MDTALVKSIIIDILRHKIQLLLGICVLASAMTVVWSAHEQRLLTAKSNQLLKERDALDVYWHHLLLEEQTHAEHSRVEQIVINELNMKRPKPSEERVIRLP